MYEYPPKGPQSYLLTQNAFRNEMAKAMSDNHVEKGDSFKNMTLDNLITLMEEKIAYIKLTNPVTTPPPADPTFSPNQAPYAVAIANYAWMIWANLQPQE